MENAVKRCNNKYLWEKSIKQLIRFQKVKNTMLSISTVLTGFNCFVRNWDGKLQCDCEKRISERERRESSIGLI